MCKTEALTHVQNIQNCGFWWSELGEILRCYAWKLHIWYIPQTVESPLDEKFIISIADDNHLPT